MTKWLALSLFIALIQCTNTQPRENNWIGTYRSGDGHFGESVTLMDGNSFRAYSFSCIIPVIETTGQWTEFENWIELKPHLSEEGNNRAQLRYRKCRFEGEYVLLKDGDAEILALMGPELKWALWKGGIERKKQFLEERQEWLELIGTR